MSTEWLANSISPFGIANLFGQVLTEKEYQMG